MGANEAYITGIGQSEIGVKLTRSPLLLTVDAVREALADAGLSIDQIDGVSTYPGRTPALLGFSPVGADELIDALGIRATWYSGGGEISSQLGAVVAAAMAVRTGQARHVLCYRTVYEAAAMSRPDEFPMPRRDRVDSYTQWLAPFNAMSAANWVAQYAMRHVKRYGLTREQLALTLLLQDPLLAALAWTFVGLRVLHAAVHLTYNAVMHRFFFYALGAVVLLMMWVRLGWLIVLR